VARAARFFAASDDLGHFPSHEATLRALQGRGFDPKLCIDVGAHVGDWTRTFKGVFPSCAVVMIDALPSLATELASCASEFADVEYVVSLLASRDGVELPFYVMGTGSSVYEEQSPFNRTVQYMTTVTLDRAVRHIDQRADFIKLDVQGSELEILSGGGERLSEAHAVLLEASLIPVNRGAPSVLTVLNCMDRAGFQLADFCSQVRQGDGVLWQADLLFIRKDSPILPTPTSIHASRMSVEHQT
jgi:FkbM family methyltransferase